MFVLLREENPISGVNQEDTRMKNYTITVNGNVYDVTVEEKGAGAAPVAAAPVAAAPVAAPAKAPAKAAGAGSIQVKAGAAGKVFKVEASVGQKAGDTVVIIEAMKMEIPVVAPEAGTVASIDVAVGDAVESGAVLATLN